MTIRALPRSVVVGLNLLLWGTLLGAAVWWVAGVVGEFQASARSTPRFNPPVWAGQSFISACSGGFYARGGQTIVLTLSAHCLEPDVRLRDGDGRLMGVSGPRAELTDCPVGRFCAPSDFLALALAPDRIPWGHLDHIDMGAGGYRVLAPGTKPLACGDIRVGDRVEIDGRERYRSGAVVEIGPYQNATDTMFPCMIVADIDVGIGDSGGAVLVNGLPAGVIARELGGYMGFTPLAEGLENLGLTLCTSPDCNLSPETADQPEE